MERRVYKHGVQVGGWRVVCVGQCGLQTVCGGGGGTKSMGYMWACSSCLVAARGGGVGGVVELGWVWLREVWQ